MNIAAKNKIVSEQGEVKNFEDFLYWVKSGTKARLNSKTFILEIQGITEDKDPIIYLYELYYEEEKSLDELIKYLGFLNIKSPSRATLHRLLFTHFGWTPRENTERTPVHEEQLSRKTEQEIARFEQQVADLMGGRKIERVFNMDEFVAKTYKIGKALYILKTLGGIDKNILYKLSVEGCLPNAVLAKALNKKLGNILEKHPEIGIKFEDVELYSQSIKRWFCYNADRGNNRDK